MGKRGVFINQKTQEEVDKFEREYLKERKIRGNMPLPQTPLNDRIIGRYVNLRMGGVSKEKLIPFLDVTEEQLLALSYMD